MLFAADRLDSTRHRVPTLLIVAYLMLLAPFASIVQVDMVAAGWLIAAIWFGKRLAAQGGLANAVWTVVFLGLTGATRTQYFLVFLAMAGILLPCKILLTGGRQEATADACRPTAAGCRAGRDTRFCFALAGG